MAQLERSDQGRPAGVRSWHNWPMSLWAFRLEKVFCKGTYFLIEELEQKELWRLGVVVIDAIKNRAVSSGRSLFTRRG